MTAQSQTHRILTRLKKHGYATNVQLNSMGIFRFSARIYELRREGHLIETVRVHDGLFRFDYKGHRDEVTA